VKHPVESLWKVCVHAVNLPPIFDFADDAIRKYGDLISPFPKKKLYRFPGQIRTFYRRKTDFYEKKSIVLPSVYVKHCCSGQNFFPFNLETCFFQASNMLVLFQLFWRICSGSSEANFNIWILRLKLLPGGPCFQRFFGNNIFEKIVVSYFCPVPQKY
jgi:hypothetical protein